MMPTRIIITLVIMVVVALAARWFRGYPWELATISGVLIGGLVFAPLQTMSRLRTTLSQFGRKHD